MSSSSKCKGDFLTGIFIRVCTDTLIGVLPGLILGTIIVSCTNWHISTEVMREISGAIMLNERIHISSLYPHSWYYVLAYQIKAMI